MGLLSIYAYLKEEGVDVNLFDPQIEKHPVRKLSKRLHSKNYNIIGIPVFTNTAYSSFNTAKLCKDILPQSIFEKAKATTQDQTWFCCSLSRALMLRSYFPSGLIFWSLTSTTSPTAR